MTLGEMREAIDYYRKQNAMKVAAIKKNYKFNQMDQANKAGDNKRRQEMLKAKEDEIAQVNSKLTTLSNMLIGLIAKDKTAREKFMAAYKTANEKNTAAMEQLTNSQIESNRMIGDLKKKTIALGKCTTENKEAQEALAGLDKDIQAQQVDLEKAQSDLEKTQEEKTQMEATNKEVQDKLLADQKELEATMATFKTAKEAVDAKLKKAEAGLEKAEQMLQEAKKDNAAAKEENAAEKASDTFIELQRRKGFFKKAFSAVKGAASKVVDGAKAVGKAVVAGAKTLMEKFMSDPSCDDGCEAMKKWKASKYYKGTLEEGHTDVTIAAMNDAVLRMKHVLDSQTTRIERLTALQKHDETLHKEIMADIEKDNEQLKDDMLQLTTDLKILREKEGKAERENTQFERDMTEFMRTSTDKLNKIQTETDALLVKDEIVRSGISAMLVTCRDLTQKSDKCKSDKDLADVAKSQKLETIKENEKKEADAIAKNQAAENEMNNMKELAAIENARLAAANEATKNEAAELNDAIQNVNDNIQSAKEEKKDLKGEILDTMSDTDNTKADTVMVKGAKKKKAAMAALDDEDEDDEIPTRAATPAPTADDSGSGSDEAPEEPKKGGRKFLKSCSPNKRKKAKKGDETWCMCNTFGIRISKQEDCENEGGGRSGVCVMDTEAKLCVPKA